MNKLIDNRIFREIDRNSGTFFTYAYLATILVPISSTDYTKHGFWLTLLWAFLMTFVSKVVIRKVYNKPDSISK